MPKKKLEVKEEVVVPVSQEVTDTSEKQRLQNLLQDLKELKVNSISDLENLIARAE